MITQGLHTRWTLELPSQEKIPATVPGSVYTALLDAGRLEDPFYRDNEGKALALMEHDYRCLLYTSPSPRDRG